MFRIRFHGRGGQGMKTASRILGNAFFLMGYEVQDAPRYGAERRGAPIFAFVRADHCQIFERGIIRKPDLIVVADDTLVPIPAAGVLEGADDHSLLLINSHNDPDIWKHRLNFSGRILTLPAAEELEDRAELPFVGASCAAAAASLCGTIPLETLKQAITDVLGHLGKTIVSRNIEVASHAYRLMQPYAGSVSQRADIPDESWQPPAWTILENESVSQSAPAIHAGLTSELMKTGLWRTMRPIVEMEHCNRCWWVCSTFCPDSAIDVDDNGYPHIDYDHCKGCLICVAQCPPHAITAVAEHLAQLGDTA
jgi:pyruvate ferredoxin oxidoreductase gamma subunit